MVAFVAEATGELRGFDARSANANPFNWRFGMAPVVRFSRCMAEARALLPPGTLVAFVSPGEGAAGRGGGGGNDDFFRWRWAAYLLPELDLVRLQDASPPQAPSYLLTYRREAPGRRFELVRQLTGGRLYRVRR